jgi:hypothetical protein
MPFAKPNVLVDCRLEGREKMKTPDEIKKGLECCTNHKKTCVECPYYNGMVGCKQLDEDVLAYIHQLESRLAQAEQDAKEMANDLDCSACTWCEYKDFDYTNEACKECRTHNEGFKLRGVCAENSKGDSNGKDQHSF